MERTVARKANNLKGEKEFLEIKGLGGQLENVGDKVENKNENISFQCLHYSVVESNGVVEVFVINKQTKGDITFGLRTVDGSAKHPTEYTAINQVYTMKRGEKELPIQIPIIDNDDWQPDLEFMVELFDPQTKERLTGDDTQTKITILDEDFPGKLGFE